MEQLYQRIALTVMAGGEESAHGFSLTMLPIPEVKFGHYGNIAKTGPVINLDKCFMLTLVWPNFHLDIVEWNAIDDVDARCLCCVLLRVVLFAQFHCDCRVRN